MPVSCGLVAEQVTFLQGIKVFASGRNRILNDLSLCFKLCPGLSETVGVFWGMFIMLRMLFDYSILLTSCYKTVKYHSLPLNIFKGDNFLKSSDN